VAQTEPVNARKVFEIEHQDDTIIVVPAVDLRELDYERIEKEGKNILDLLNGTTVKNVVMDFHKTNYYGSTALGLFLKLWKRARMQNGRMAFCNVSDFKREILQVTKLDHFWPICSSRIEALAAVNK